MEGSCNCGQGKSCLREMEDRLRAGKVTCKELYETFEDNDTELALFALYLEHTFGGDGIPEVVGQTVRLLNIRNACKCGDSKHTSCLFPLLKELQFTGTVSNMPEFVKRFRASERTEKSDKRIGGIIANAGKLSEATKFMLSGVFFLSKKEFKLIVEGSKINFGVSLKDWYEFMDWTPEEREIISSVYQPEQISATTSRQQQSTKTYKFLECACNAENHFPCILRKYPGQIPHTLHQYLTLDAAVDFFRQALKLQEDKNDVRDYFWRVRTDDNNPIFRKAEVLARMEQRYAEGTATSEEHFQAIADAIDSYGVVFMKTHFASNKEALRDLDVVVGAILTRQVEGIRAFNNKIRSYSARKAASRLFTKQRAEKDGDDFAKWILSGQKGDEKILAKHWILGSFSSYMIGMPENLHEHQKNQIKDLMVTEDDHVLVDLLFFAETCCKKCGSVICKETISQVLGSFGADSKAFFLDRLFDLCNFVMGADSRYKVLSFDHPTHKKDIDLAYTRRIMRDMDPGLTRKEILKEAKARKCEHIQVLKENIPKEKRTRFCLVPSSLEQVVPEDKLKDYLKEELNLESPFTFKDRTIYRVITVLSSISDEDRKKKMAGKFLLQWETLPTGNRVVELTKTRRNYLKAIKASTILPKQLKTYLRDCVCVGQTVITVPELYACKTVKKEIEQIFFGYSSVKQ